ncbi:MAG: helix-turn-helix domain-containing protein, partial [Pirellulales bacterium]
MQLSVREVARMMQVSERVVYRWVTDESLPAQLVAGQYRFNRAELFEWAAIRKITPPADLVQPLAGGANGAESLAAALETGGVLYDVDGNDKPAVLRTVVERMPLAKDIDRPLILDLLLARESVGSTAVGD